MSVKDAGAIVAQIRLELTQMERDMLNANTLINNFSKKAAEQGKKGGEAYVKGFGTAQRRLNSQLNNMVNSMQALSPKMGMMGQKMATAFSKPIFTMVPTVGAAFTAMLGPIGMVIQGITLMMNVAKAAVGFVSNLFKKKKDGAAEATREIGKTEQAYKDMNKAILIVQASLALGFTDRSEALKQEINARKDLIQLLIEEYSTLLRKNGAENEASLQLKQQIEDLMKINETQEKVASSVDNEAAARNAVTAAQDKYNIAIARAQQDQRRGLITLNELQRLQNEALEQQYKDLQAIHNTYGAIGRQLTQNTLETTAAQINTNRAAEAAAASARGLAAERLAAQAEFNRAEAEANRKLTDRQMTEEQHAKAINDAYQRQLDTLTALIIKYNANERNAKHTMEDYNRVLGIVLAHQDATEEMRTQEQLKISRMWLDSELLSYSEEMAKNTIKENKALLRLIECEEERADVIEETLKLELALIEVQRAREWEAIEQLDRYQNLSKDQQKELQDAFESSEYYAEKVQAFRQWLCVKYALVVLRFCKKYIYKIS